MTGSGRSTVELDDVGSLLPKRGAASLKVRQVIAEKSRNGAVTVSPESSVYDALSAMADHNIGALVVVDGGRVVGVISERDYARKVILIGKTSRETAVEEIMGSPVVTVSPDATVAECMALMTSRFLRHLPVVERGELVGLVSIGDIVKTVLADQEEQLRRMSAYISGDYPT
jgi:CBS domain-containing protein